MKIVEIPIEELKSNKNHLRINLKKKDYMFKCLMTSVVNFGLQYPLLINEDYEIISGNQLLKVLKLLNYKKIPCIIVKRKSMNEQDLSIALNKIKGDWFIQGLRKYFKKNSHSKKTLENLGFKKLEAESLMVLDKFPDLENENDDDNQLRFF